MGLGLFVDDISHHHLQVGDIHQGHCPQDQQGIQPPVAPLPAKPRHLLPLQQSGPHGQQQGQETEVVVGQDTGHATGNVQDILHRPRCLPYLKLIVVGDQKKEEGHC